MKNTIFKNERLAAQLEENGWAIIDFFKPENAERLKQKFEEFLPAINKMPVIITLIHESREITKKINEEIMREATPFLDEHFTDYKSPIALFFAKKPEAECEVGLHQDPMITDQVSNPSYGLWIPLVKTDEHNGTLAVLDKSHRWFHPFQADTVDSPLGNIGDALVKECKTISLNPGQAVIMDNRLVHYSHPNKSGQIRPCVVIKLTHTAASYFTLYRKNGEIFVIKNNEGFYLNETWIYDKSEFPAGDITGILDFAPYSLTFDDYKKIASANLTDFYQTRPLTAWMKEAVMPAK